MRRELIRIDNRLGVLFSERDTLEAGFANEAVTPAEAVTLLADCRTQHEQNLLKDPARADWVPLLQYHQGLALKEAGKVNDARGLFEAIVKQYPNWPQVADAIWRDGQCRKELAIAMQVRVSESPTHAFLGQWYAPVALRKNVTGNLESPVTIFWNVEKK